MSKAESTWVETGCVFEHEGRQYESGGAVMTRDEILASMKIQWDRMSVGPCSVCGVWHHLVDLVCWDCRKARTGQV